MRRLPEPKWVRFVQSYPPNSSRRKTDVWAVESKDGGALGYIAWYAPWRCYCFMPSSSTVFEQRCLRDIATFLRFQMAERKRARGAA